MDLKQIGEEIALHQLKIGAIKLQPENPFTWASGWKSPIYNDNRRLLFFPEMIDLVVDGFRDIMADRDLNNVDKLIIAGTATAGIPHGAMLAYSTSSSFVYVREKQKEHGMGNQIEGIDPGEDFGGEEVLLIEDLISTGGSSAATVAALRKRGGKVSDCFCIFDYGFPKAVQMFNGEIPFRNEETLLEPCIVSSLLTYPVLLEVAITHGFVDKGQEEFLLSWYKDPESWSNAWKAEHPE
ncbi:MAG: orotate phosphoribosyltransferase [Patescibacteria group bacterium]